MNGTELDSRTRNKDYQDCFGKSNSMTVHEWKTRMSDMSCH